MTDLENFDYVTKSDIEEAIESIEKINSYTALHNLKNFFDKARLEVGNGEIYFSARKNRYVTLFDIMLSDGTKISEITVNGNCDNIPYEMQKAFEDSYISDVEKLIAVIDEKLRLAEIEEKKFKKNMIFFAVFNIITFAIFLSDFFS